MSMFLRPRVFGGLLALLLIVIAAGATAGEPEKYALDNGLEVLLLENHRAPVVSMLVWVKVGSASEGPEEIGLAHVMEHMAFKGTGKRAPGEIAREVEAAGGSTNAYTSFDETVYYIDMASRFAERGLDILADMVLNPSLDPAEFAREKEVVVEEILRGQDLPGRRLSEKLFVTAYQRHPYGRPIIGYADTVRGVSRETAVSFHQRWYRPNNMLLVVAGDFDPDQVKRQIEQSFGSGPKGAAPSDVRAAEPPQTKTRVAFVRADVKVAQLQLGFHIPPLKDPDTNSLDVLAAVIGQGRTSRLYSKVKREQELVYSIAAGAYTPQDPGIFVVNAELAPDKIPEALESIIKEIRALAKGPVDANELARAKLNIKTDFVHSRSTMSGEARTLASFEVMMGDYRAKERYLADLDELTPADLQAVAAKYLNPENLTVAVLIPENGPPVADEAAVLAAVARGAAADEPTVAATEPAPTVRTYPLTNGGTLLVKADHSLPLVSVRAAFLGGLRFETAETNGVNNFLAQVWDRGTTRLSADELDQAVEDIAGSLNAFSGRNSFGLEAEFLSQYLDQGLRLFAEVLTSPALEEKEVGKARPNILAAIEQQDDQLTSRAFRLFARTLYGDHPYGREVLGDPESVARISAGDLRAYYDQWARPSNMVLAVVGNVDPEDVYPAIERLLKDWSPPPVRPPDVQAPQMPQEPREAREVLNRSQEHLIEGFLTPGLESPDRYALEVLDNVLSGMGGRLFIELRDKQSLAYTVTSFYYPGLNTGSFGLYIGFDPAKADSVRSGFQDILAGVTSRSVSVEELARAKEYLLGSYEVGLQTFSAQASDLAFNELYGLGYDYGRRYIDGINNVTAEDVLRAARTYLDPARAVTVMVGPISQ